MAVNVFRVELRTEIDSGSRLLLGPSRSGRSSVMHVGIAGTLLAGLPSARALRANGVEAV